MAGIVGELDCFVCLFVCRVSQLVELLGDLAMDETGCNERMEGQVFLFNPDAAEISEAKIVLVRCFFQ